MSINRCSYSTAKTEPIACIEMGVKLSSCNLLLLALVLLILVGEEPFGPLLGIEKQLGLNASACREHNRSYWQSMIGDRLRGFEFGV